MAIHIHAQQSYNSVTTKLSFYYTCKTSNPDGSTEEMMFGSSSQAPMLTNTDGVILVSSKNKASDATGTANLPSTNTPFNNLVMFSAIDVPQDNSLNGGCFYNADYSTMRNGNNYGFHTTKSGDYESFAFTFQYDPINKLSSIAIAANTTGMRTSKAPGDDIEAHRDDNTKTTIGIGVNATSNPAQSIYGSPSNNPDAAYLTLTKTTTGYRINYHKNTTTGEADFQTIKEETLVAYIGEPSTEYEAVITPINCDYEHWLPMGPDVKGDDNKTGNTQLQFYIDVHKKGDPSYKYPGLCQVNWNLTDVTHYPGFCNNFPAYSDHPNTDADLVFNDAMKQDGMYDANTVTPFIATSKQGNANAAIAKIMCMDYAAWGKLSAMVILDDGTMINAINNYNGKGYATLPLDKDENKLADEWEKTYNTNKHALTWDEDGKPVDQRDNGDGYTLFEEYRGFAVHVPSDPQNNTQAWDEFTRTDPDTKDAFVYDIDGLFQHAFSITNPTNLNWHYLSRDKNQLVFFDDIQQPTCRWVNFNTVDAYTYAPQYCVAIRNSDQSSWQDPLATGISYSAVEWRLLHTFTADQLQQLSSTQIQGLQAQIDAEETTINNSPVKKHIMIELFPSKLKEKYQYLLDKGRTDLFNAAIEQGTIQTVYHEVGHCIGIPHHKAPSNANTTTMDFKSCSASDGAECIMRYDVEYATTDKLNYHTNMGPFAAQKTYCKKGQQGIYYYRQYTVDETGKPIKTTYTIMKGGVKDGDNCYGKISVRSAR
jgi:YD repeat-containing protein